MPPMMPQHWQGRPRPAGDGLGVAAARYGPAAPQGTHLATVQAAPRLPAGATVAGSWLRGEHLSTGPALGDGLLLPVTDVADGSNDYLSARGHPSHHTCRYLGKSRQPCYWAVHGYDMATGLGTPQAAPLTAGLLAESGTRS